MAPTDRLMRYWRLRAELSFRYCLDTKQLSLFHRPWTVKNSTYLHQSARVMLNGEQISLLVDVRWQVTHHAE